jgi:hypothetical protein
MPDLLSLTVRVADLATRPARFAIGKLLQLRDSDSDRDQAPLVAEPPRPEPPQSAKPAPKRKAPAKRRPEASPAARVAAKRAEEHPSGPTIEVAAPWDGYDAMTEDQVLERMIGADDTLRAMVRLYESTHGGRRQILIATEAPAQEASAKP